MSESRGGEGIRHRSREYDSRRGLLRLVIAGAVIVCLVAVSIEVGLLASLAENVEDSMHTQRANSTDSTPRPHTDPNSNWRLSLNRSLDAEYTTNADVEPLEVRTIRLEVIEFVNAQRVERGVEPLFLNWELSRLNRWYAGEINEMSETSSLHNNSRSGRDSYGRAKWAGYPVERCTRYAEVITTSVYLRGFERTEKNAAAITEAWMRSDSHRKGILNEQYDVAGVGIFVAEDDTRIAVMTLCDRSDIPDEELNGWEDAKYQGEDVAIPYDVAVAGGEWDSTGNLTETPDETDTATG